MLKRYKDYKKLYILIISSVFCYALCYKVAFKKTFYEYKLYRKNKSQIEGIKDSPNQLDSILKRLKDYDHNINYNYSPSDNYQVLLLEKSTQFSKSKTLIITGIQKIVIEETDEFKIKTQEIVYQGEFHELLKFLLTISGEKDIGRISSVEFFNQKDVRTKDQVLRLKIVFQLVTSKS